MGRILTPQDAHAIMNELAHQATGKQSIRVIDTASFISAGETVLATGTENVLNSLGIVIGKTLMASRPYKAKLKTINAINSGIYSTRVRKISIYSKDSVASGDYNTQLFTNLKDGFTNGQNKDQQGVAQSTKSQWEQSQPVVLEMNFGGSDVWEEVLTIYEDQLAVAFQNEANFNSFVAGIMTEKANDIEQKKEAFNRLALINHMAGVIDMSADMAGSAVNLTAEFNAETGNSYTTAQLLTTYFTEFLEFFVARFKLDSDYLSDRSALYHWSPAKTVEGVNYTLLRHTPKDKQRAIMFNPFFVKAKAKVLPEIFNPQYLDIDNFETVNYWQSITTPSAINIEPTITDTTTGLVKKGDAVNQAYVLGCLFDEDALMIDYQLDTATSTALEARKRYRNLWWSFRKNIMSDYTENFIVYYMAD